MPTRNRRLLLALALASLVVLAGCSGGSNDAAAPANGDGAATDGAGAPPNEDDRAGGETRSALDVQQRALVRTGNVTLRVQSFDAAHDNLTEVARSRGGFVSDSSERVHRRENRTWTSGTLVLRVPSENFSTAFRRVEREGNVTKSNTATTDVTDRLVDLNARLKNLRSQRERLRGLYENASDTEAVLEVQKRLSTVQSDIERLEAKKQSLERRVAYSTITVELAEPKPDPEPTATDDERAWYETDVVAAFVDSARGTLVVLRALVVGGAYLLPYAVVFGVPVAGAVVLWRRRTATSTEAATEEN